MNIDVTVVVPVYNPGPYIDSCIEGLLSQTLPVDRREFVFVDDGSTDDTPKLLDRLAAAHSDVRVIHQPNSGWPGKPRNVGIAVARGDYVFFHDHDDWLNPDALRRMVAMARRTHADVLIPKMVGHHRKVPRTIFRTNLDRAVLGKDPLMSSLTPHKLLRREFLDEHKLRFPEGRRRLEDHVFVAEAFLRADVISVLSDYPCYHRVRRHDESNAAFQKWDSDYYFGFVSEVIDVIEAHTEPGEFRNSLTARTYAGEMLSKLVGRRLRHWDAKTRRQIFVAVQELVLNRYPAGFHERLAIAPRAAAQAVVDNRLDRMTDLADWTASTQARAVLHDLTWSDTGWSALVEAELFQADGSPILVTPTVDGGWSVDPRVIPPELAPASYSLEQIRQGATDVVLSHEGNDVEWFALATVRSALEAVPDNPDGAHRLVCRGTVAINPETAAGGRPLAAGKWNLELRMANFGIGRVVRLEVDPDVAATVPSPGVFLASRRFVDPVITKREKHLAFKVAKIAPERHARIGEALRYARDVAVSASGTITATIDVAGMPEERTSECRVVLTNTSVAASKRRTDLDVAAATQVLIAYVANTQPYPATSLDDQDAKPLAIKAQSPASIQLRRLRRRWRGVQRQVGRLR